MTVGVYDAASEKEQDKIREQADIYLEAFAGSCGKNMKIMITQNLIYMEFTNFSWRRIKICAMINNVEVSV